MVHRKCCACGIREETALQDKVSLHKFPRDEELSNTWATNLGNKMIINEHPEDRHKKYFLCSRHFEITMFPYQIRSRRLKKTAVPIIFIPEGTGEIEELVAGPSDLPTFEEPVLGTSVGIGIVLQSQADIETAYLFQEEPEIVIGDEDINTTLDNLVIDQLHPIETNMRMEPFNEHSYAAAPHALLTELLQSQKSKSTQTSPTPYSTPREEMYRKQIRCYKRRIQILESRFKRAVAEEQRFSRTLNKLLKKTFRISV